MDVEKASLTRLLETGDMLAAVKSKITSSFYLDSETREVFLWAEASYLKHGSLPSLDMAEAEFPDFAFEQSGDDLGVLFDGLKQRKLYADIQAGLKKVTVATRGSAAEGLAEFQNIAMELITSHAEDNDLDVAKSGKSVLDRYQYAKDHEGLLGYPMPWPRYTKMMKGLRGGQHIGFYGDTGTFKTWLLVECATYLHEEVGITPVFFTKETPPEDILFRTAARRARVDWELVQEGHLAPDDEKRFYATVQSLEDDPPFHIVEVMSQGLHALAEVRAKCVQYKARVALIDNLYYLAEDLEWRSFGLVSMGVRQLSKDLDIGFITSNQTNNTTSRSNSGPVADVGYGKAYAQSCTVLTRVICEPVHREQNELVLWTKKINDGRPCRIVVEAKPGESFTQKREITEDDAPAAGIDEEDGGIV